METVLLVRFGEIFLKGNNRSYFMSTLRRNMQAALHGMETRVEAAEGRYFVHGGDINEAARRIRRVFGVHSVSPAVACDKDMDEIRAQAAAMMSPLKDTFKVSARRSDKRFPLDSMELNRDIGSAVLAACPQLTVDVHAPDHTLEVEIRERAYLHVEKLPAVGGMPVGTGGRAMLLLSGGIDSPVAGYQIARRGVTIEAVHYHSFPYTSEQAKQKVIDLTKILGGYCGPIKLHIVPFTQIQQTLYEKCPDSQLTILMRRAMMRVAESIAHRARCSALITGESLGQVASQTMASLVCTDDVCTMPVFRPLIGMDKSEIIEIAHRIGTYDTSVLPYEDCCTIFTPKHPNTRPRIDKIEESERILDWQPMLEAALAGTELLEVQG